MRYAPFLLLVAVVALPATTAQPTPQVPGWGFAWERVGDFPPSPNHSLGVGFDGRVWVTGFKGIAELHERADGTTFWRRYVTAYLSNPLVIRDTLWYTIESTLGNGQVFVHPRGTPWVYFPDGTNSPGGGFVVEGPPTSTAPGRFFTSSRGSVGYSDSRGLLNTWTDAGVVPNPENTTTTFADDIALFPAPAYGGAYPGRVLLAGPWGVAISDDRGTSWRISSLWRYLVHQPDVVVTLARPGGGTRAVAFGAQNGETCRCSRAYLSEDAGEMWTEVAQLTGHGFTQVVSVAPLPSPTQTIDVPSYETPSALVLLKGGTMWRTDDGGATWTQVGQVPLDYVEDKTTDLLVAPDRRLYVSTRAFRLSVDSAWVWRTAEPFPVASSAPPEPSEIGVTVRPNPSGGMAVVTLALPRAATVEAAVYDALGRRVIVLHDGPLGAGERRIEVDVSGWPPGAYVVRTVMDGRIRAAPLTVVR